MSNVVATSATPASNTKSIFVKLLKDVHFVGELFLNTPSYMIYEAVFVMEAESNISSNNATFTGGEGTNPYLQQ